MEWNEELFQEKSGATVAKCIRNNKIEGWERDDYWQHARMVWYKKYDSYVLKYNGGIDHVYKAINMAIQTSVIDEYRTQLQKTGGRRKKKGKEGLPGKKTFSVNVPKNSTQTFNSDDSTFLFDPPVKDKYNSETIVETKDLLEHFYQYCQTDDEKKMLKMYCDGMMPRDISEAMGMEPTVDNNKIIGNLVVNIRRKMAKNKGRINVDNVRMMLQNGSIEDVARWTQISYDIIERINNGEDVHFIREKKPLDVIIDKEILTRKEYYLKNKEIIVKHQKKYYEKNKENIRQRHKEAYEKKKLKLIKPEEPTKPVNSDSEEYKKQYRKEYYQANKERFKAGWKKWKENHPDYYKEYYSRKKKQV